MHARWRPIAFAATLALLGCASASSPTVANAMHQPELGCLDCSYTATLETWNGTGDPASEVGGALRIENTGGARDTYHVEASTGDRAWPVRVSPQGPVSIPAGRGAFASEKNSTLIDIRIRIPDDAAALDGRSVTIRVSSNGTRGQPDANVTMQRSVDATQRFGWIMSCDFELGLRKGVAAASTLLLNNTGNGPDRVVVNATADPGLRIEIAGTVESDPAQERLVNVTIGASLRIADGQYPILWNATHATRGLMAQCRTDVRVTGGSGVIEAPVNETVQEPQMPGLGTVGSMMAVLGAVALARSGTYGVDRPTSGSRRARKADRTRRPSRRNRDPSKFPSRAEIPGRCAQDRGGGR